MGSSDVPPLRSLPRLFWPGFDLADGEQELPKDELHKLRDVLRLHSGSEVAVLPNDGTIVRCRFVGRAVEPLEVVKVGTDASREVVIAQALPKGDKLDEVVRLCTEVGVAGFVLFPTERSVVNWDERKREERTRRLATIAREASEVCGRAKLPTLVWKKDLVSVLSAYPDALVLSEVEGVENTFRAAAGGAQSLTIVVGPEGGWTRREIEMIGDRAVTLGPRVLRVDTAAVSAAAIALLS
ncbi:MAG: Ribosomal RNA small subunit methyltransferase E [Fimbriimonadaceae bacterium]|nr:Ribosomal RNA small subunit methyltransferase E [Fimbriimonadaceae bacterium]